MDGDLGEADIVKGEGGTGAADGFAGEEVVEDVVGEVDGDGGGVFLCDGADEDARAEKELRIYGESAGFVGIEEPQCV